MCGRVVSSTSLSVLAEHFLAEAVIDSGDGASSWNVAPTALLPVVAESPSDHHRRIGRMRWGLIPHWAHDPSVGGRLINARAETLTTKPAFKEAFAQRRCIVVVDAFYEWRKRPNHPKQPYVIGRADEQPLAFAGLWEVWRPPDVPEAEPLRTCTVITTDANDLVRPLHDRMPAILLEEAWADWLDPTNHDVQAFQRFLRPPPSEGLVAYPVSRMVNSADNDGPELILRLPEAV